MSGAKLDIAFWNYDRTQALADGRVKIAGADATFHSGRIVTEIFEAMIRDSAYDVSELGMTYFLRTIEGRDPPYLAMPVFPVRSFRHGAIYINKTKGIKGPADLNGRTIGELAVYGHDAGVMPKGILSDAYGFKPETCRWIIGGIDFPIRPVDYIPQNHPENVKVTSAQQGADLGQMLEAGEIDALISADIPQCVLRRSPKVGRLFEDYEVAERDYFGRTGIFPIMHTVVVKAALAGEQPDLIKAVYQGFCDAKQAMVEQYLKGMTFNNMQVMVPWLTGLIGSNRELMGEDWWPYGVKANHAAIDTVLRYHYEQGLTRRRFAVEDIFVPYLLET
jgi:4,5-dihydroxyphthalate decarboxylase